MEHYTIKGKYKIADNIISFSRKVSVDEGIIKGKDLEGRMNDGELIFSTDDMSFGLSRRIKGKDFGIYAGEFSINKVYAGDAVALIKRLASKE
jgi:hypothetical protein